MAEAGPWIFDYDVGRTYADETQVTDADEENVVALQRKHISPWFVALSPDQQKLAILQVAHVLIIQRDESLANASTTVIPLPVADHTAIFARDLCWAHDNENLLFTSELGQCFVYSLTHDVWAEISHPLLAVEMPVTGLFCLSTQGRQIVFAVLRHSPAQLCVIKAHWSHSSVLEVADVTEHALGDFFVSTDAGCVSADRQTLLVVGQKTNTDMDYAVLVLYKIRVGFSGLDALHEVSLRRGGATEVKAGPRSWVSFFTGSSSSVRFPKPVSKVRMVQFDKDSSTLIALLDADGHVSIAIAGERGFTIHAERQTLEYLTGGAQPTTSIELSARGPTLIAVSADGEVVPFTVHRDGTAVAADVVEAPPKFGRNVSTVASQTESQAFPCVYLVCGPPTQFGCQVQPIQMQAVDRIQAVKTRAAEHVGDLSEALNFARALSVAPDIVYKAAWRSMHAKRRFVTEPLIAKVLGIIHDPWWVAVECASCVGVTATDTEALLQLGLHRTSKIGRGDEAMAMIRRCLLTLAHTHTTFLKILQLVGRAYEPSEFQAFVETPLETIATQFAAGGCVDCLAILFQRHAGCMARSRLEILSCIPGYVHPMQYQYLLPAHAFPGPDSRSLHISSCMVAGKAQPLIDGKAFPVEEVFQHSIQYTAVEEFILEHGLPIHPLFVESLYEFQPSDAEVSAESLVRWFSKRALMIESTTGYTAHAAYFASLALERCKPQPATESRDVLQELHNQLFHFATLVYSRLLPTETTFPMWLRSDAQDIIRSAIRIADVDDLPQVLENYVQPLFAGARRLFQVSPSAFVGACRELTAEDDSMVAASFTSTTSAQWPTDVEDLLVDSLLDKLRSDVRSGASAAETLEKIVFVAEASKPTIVVEKRLLKRLRSLLLLVVEGITVFDQAKTGLPLFWRLVECTPNVVEDESLTQLTQRLDAVSSALASCDILSRYMEPPPVSLLLVDSASHHVTHLTYLQDLWSRCKELALEVLRCARELPTCATLVDTSEALTVHHLLILGTCAAVRNSSKPDWPLLLEHIIDLATNARIQSGVEIPDLWWHVVVLKTLLLNHEYAAVPEFVRGGIHDQMVTEMVQIATADLINSASSCADQTLAQATKCAEISPINSPEILSERAFLRALNMLNDLQVDMVPLGVRTMTPIDVVSKVLQSSPDAYLEAPSPVPTLSAAAGTQRSGGLGARLMRLARELGAESPDERGAVRLRIAQHALDRADGVGCVGITDDVLDMLPTLNDDKLVASICGLVSKLCAGRSLQSKELQALRVRALSVCPSDCLTPLLRYSSPSEDGSVSATTDIDARSPLHRIVADWQADLKMQEIQSSSDKQLTQIVQKQLTELGNQSIDSYHDDLFLWLVRKEVIALLRGFGIAPEHRSSPKDVLSRSVQHEQILFMLLDVEDSAKVRKLFALISSFLVELQERSVGQEGHRAPASARKTFVEPDPGLVAGVASMGFSNNGAERACSATNNESLEAALRWAIEHNSDPDFDLPMTHRGQPLGYAAAPSRTGLQTAVADALRIINRLASTYFSVSMVLSQVDDPAERHRILHRDIHNLQDNAPTRSRSTDDRELAAGAQQFSVESRRAEACAAIGKFIPSINMGKLGSNSEYTRSVFFNLVEMAEAETYELAMANAELFGVDHGDLLHHAVRFICSNKSLMSDFGRAFNNEEPSSQFVGLVYAGTQRQAPEQVLDLLQDAMRQHDGQKLGELEVLFGLLIAQTKAVAPNDPDQVKKYQEQLALLKRVKRALRTIQLDELLNFKTLIAWDNGHSTEQAVVAAAVKEAAKVLAVDNINTIGKAVSKLLDVDMSHLICARLMKTISESVSNTSEIQSVDQLLGSEGSQLLQRLDDQLASAVWHWLLLPHAPASAVPLTSTRFDAQALYETHIELEDRMRIIDSAISSGTADLLKLDARLAADIHSHLSTALQLPVQNQQAFEETYGDAALLDQFVAKLLACPIVDFAHTMQILLPTLEDSSVEQAVVRLAPTSVQQILRPPADEASTVGELISTLLSRVREYCGPEVAQREAASATTQAESSTQLTVEVKLAIAQACARFKSQEVESEAEGSVLLLQTQLCLQKHSSCFVGGIAALTPSADDVADEEAMRRYVVKLVASLSTESHQPFHVVIQVLRLWKWSVHGSNGEAQQCLAHRLMGPAIESERVIPDEGARFLPGVWDAWDSVISAVIDAKAWSILIDILIVDLGRLTLPEAHPIREAQQIVDGRLGRLLQQLAQGLEATSLQIALACGGSAAESAVAQMLDADAADPWYNRKTATNISLGADDTSVRLLLLQPVSLWKVVRSSRYPSIVRCVLDQSGTVEAEVLQITHDADVAHPLRPELYICRLVAERLPLQAAAALCEHCHLAQPLRTPSGSISFLRQWLARDAMISPAPRSLDSFQDAALRVLVAMDATA